MVPAAGILVIVIGFLVARLLKAPPGYAAWSLVVGAAIFFPVILGSMFFGAVLMRRAGSLAAQYIRLADHSTLSAVPNMYLRRLDRFDDFMVIVGTPSEGNFTPNPSPMAYLTAEREHDRVARKNGSSPGSQTPRAAKRNNWALVGGSLILTGILSALIAAGITLVSTYERAPETYLVTGLVIACIVCFAVGTPMIYRNPAKSSPKD
ncbi:hypothetical protein QN367_17690 [Cryobacterium sp. RTS3]|uniref:hypothetical protein n=1 Tax=Cryobacterium sp. RTS3 TaxID=3048643 RepID=UPI002B226F4A|nr:hypothetical protein [Cryobacterium sp. RTS3]MEB0000907.1 hypothetical protein [Cryobacterium sp. RTS3]